MKIKEEDVERFKIKVPDLHQTVDHSNDTAAKKYWVTHKISSNCSQPNFTQKNSEKLGKK